DGWPSKALCSRQYQRLPSMEIGIKGTTVAALNDRQPGSRSSAIRQPLEGARCLIHNSFGQGDRPLCPGFLEAKERPRAFPASLNTTIDTGKCVNTFFVARIESTARFAAVQISPVGLRRLDRRLDQFGRLDMRINGLEALEVQDSTPIYVLGSSHI